MRRTLWSCRALFAVALQITSTVSVCAAHPIQLGPIRPSPTSPFSPRARVRSYATSEDKNALL